MNPSISIIIPVYNAEKFLRECIDSILKIQNLLDWELILVDDGSADSSANICDEYAFVDSRVHVFHIENGGVSNARNFGLKNANKDFVTFVDADDWIEADVFVKSFDSFVKFGADIGYTPFYKGNETKFSKVPLNFGDTRLLRPEEKKNLLENRLAPSDRFFGFVWRNFYSRNLVKNINFDRELKYNEDVLFSVQALHAANRAAIVNIPFYYYRVNEFSACFNKEVNSIENRKIALEKMLEWARINGVDLSYTKIKRMCPIYARMFAKAAAENEKKGAKVKALWKIHAGIDSKEIRQWKSSYFGKSFRPYVIFRRCHLNFLGFVYLCVRFF